MSASITPQQVAEWMLAEVKRLTYLDQSDAAFRIERDFGAGFCYINDLGNTSIEKTVLKLFRTISGDNVVWERTEKQWRLREPHDHEGRGQD